MFSNLLADFTVRFNTGLKNKSGFIFIPYTKINAQIMWLLLRQGCIRFFFIDTDPSTSTLRIKVVFKFVRGVSVVNSIDLVSKPGLRVYWTVAELSKNFSRNTFQGFYLISTPNGFCTSNELLLMKTVGSSISGEVILKVTFQ